ncbi:MAG: FG-GAP repeat domain-containing protein [Planctomycetota bacterium]|jgi:hypothetical protein
MLQFTASFFLALSATAGDPPTPVFLDLGPGTPGVLGTPRLFRQGVPAIGEFFALDLAFAAPGSVGIAVLSAGVLELPLPDLGGVSYVAPPFEVLPFSVGLDGGVPGVGFAFLDPVPVELLGGPLVVQAAVVDGAAAGGLSLSNAVRCVIGDQAAAPFLVAGSAALSTGQPSALVAGDFNGDGFDDQIAGVQPTLPFFSGEATLYAGAGDGTFAALEPVELVGNPLDLQAGDFDGDGNLDLVAIELGDTRASLLLGDGDFGFTSLISIDASGFLRRALPFDADGDGHLDLLLVSVSNVLSGSTQVQVALNRLATGSGFLVGSGFELTSTELVDVDAADIDGDGLQDLLATTGEALWSAVGLGGGSFAAAEAVVAAAPDLTFRASALVDLDGDGRPDLLSASAGAALTPGRLDVRLGSDSGVFGPPTSYPANLDPADVRVADVDDDGAPDAILLQRGATGSAGSLGVYFGTGDGSLSAQHWSSAGLGTPQFLSTGDWDGDGGIDVAVLNLGGVGLTGFLNATP